MHKNFFILIISLCLVLPSTIAFTYDEVIDTVTSFIESYNNFITGKIIHTSTQPQDVDGDGVLDPNDNCVYVPNGPLLGTCVIGLSAGQTCQGTSQTCSFCDQGMQMGSIYLQRDFDSDGSGDACDNCYNKPNGPLRGTCTAGPSKGNACDLVTSSNPCNLLSNQITPLVCQMDQEDLDNNGIGDACDIQYIDTDADGWPDSVDNCPTTFNPSQLDSDGDGLGDNCDPCIFQATISNDRDGDSYNDYMYSNCVGIIVDCDDNDGLSYPGAPENCEDGKDNNCDGNPDSTDPICLKTGPKGPSFYQYKGGPVLTTVQSSGPPTVQQPSPTGQPQIGGENILSRVKQVVDLIETINKNMVVLSKNIKALVVFMDPLSPEYTTYLTAQIKLETLSAGAREAMKNAEEGKYNTEQDFQHLRKRARTLLDGLDDPVFEDLKDTTSS